MASRFEKFSERARRVLSLAQEEAQRFNHNYIGTEHILLGLVRETEGVAARVLHNLGVELTKVRRIQPASTRTYHPGVHQVDLQVSGRGVATTRFELTTN